MSLRRSRGAPVERHQRRARGPGRHDDPVAALDESSVFEQLQQLLDNEVQVVTLGLVGHWIHIAVHGHAPTTGNIW